ncbi:hypothetical protein KIH74_17420 [Kineosporia sp. J2-2]|uniref:GH26 domain-containing protein n=1 Tax=Kineosporia corallincola TaxID=2835133 RepID=A0ABS5TKY1_9ACTN|nr:hypothetical protein [Kineosporia corallincola]MBT0770728.1 hypothetical protein [Kineosporia corallincola]
MPIWPFSRTSAPARTPTTDLITWSSGVHTTGHSLDEARAFAARRGRPLGHFAVFPSRDAGPAGLADTWWLPPRDLGEMISVAVPMTYDGGSLADDLSEPLRRMAGALAADGRVCVIRLGWEFNLANWPWHVTEANLPQWRARFAQYASLFRAELGERALVGLNANIGGSQTGMRPDWAERVWMPEHMHWAGPDAYDCYEPYTTDAAVAAHWNGQHGLRWWSDFALAQRVPLALPEWGVASGTQWAGHRGGDNPRYVAEMHAFLRYHVERGGTVLLDTYFHEREPYLRSDFDANPRAGAEYARRWGPAVG